MTRLAGKVAFVTGAAGAIGAAICRRFLEEGAHVGGIDIAAPADDTALAAAARDGRGLAMTADASESAAVKNSIERTAAAFGRLDVLCSIAGGSSNADGPVTEAPEEEFWRVMKLDLFGTFLTARHGIPHLQRAGGGSVINMTSMVALMGVPNRDCYTAAKGGIAALTRSMALEFGPSGIRVNAIAPGITLSPRVAGFLETNEAMRALAARHVLGAAEPVDVAEMAVFLAADESRKVTGQILSVDSGVTIC